MLTDTARGWIVMDTGNDMLRSSTLDEVASKTQTQHPTEAEEDARRHGQGNGLSTDGRWICRHGQSLIWLLPGYRASSSAAWNTEPCINNIAAAIAKCFAYIILFYISGSDRLCVGTSGHFGADRGEFSRSFC